jgi:hypothetical protein
MKSIIVMQIFLLLMPAITKLAEINTHKAYPDFSWDYVPKFAHVGAQGVTTQQLNYLADNYHLVQFTGGSGKAQNVQYIIAKHAKYLKARNPGIPESRNKSIILFTER